MARSFSNAKLLSSFVVDQLSVIVTRRGCAAAASQGVVGSGSVRGGASGRKAMLKKAGEESTKTTSWVPDPVTGYYRPENIANEIDAAELREMLLKHKIRRH